MGIPQLLSCSPELCLCSALHEGHVHLKERLAPRSQIQALCVLLLELFLRRARLSFSLNCEWNLFTHLFCYSYFGKLGSRRVLYVYFVTGHSTEFSFQMEEFPPPHSQSRPPRFPGDLWLPSPSGVPPSPMKLPLT